MAFPCPVGLFNFLLVTQYYKCLGLMFPDGSFSNLTTLRTGSLSACTLCGRAVLTLYRSLKARTASPIMARTGPMRLRICFCYCVWVKHDVQLMHESVEGFASPAHASHHREYNSYHHYQGNCLRRAFQFKRYKSMGSRDVLYTPHGGRSP